MAEKAQQFLIIVQTMFLANAINRRADDKEGVERHVYSASMAFIVMDDAVYASERIPADMTASEAANSFASFAIPGLKELDECPAWFARS